MEIKNMINNIKIKHGAKILDIFVITLIGIMIFGAFLTFTTDNAIQSAVDVPSRYNESYQKLLTTEDNLSVTVNEIRDSMQDLTEADNIAQVAFNGIKGVLALFKLPLKILSPVLLGINLFLDMLDFVPTSVIVTIALVLTVILVFAFLKFVTQRGNDA